jgi:hypothetical protein
MVKIVIFECKYHETPITKEVKYSDKAKKFRLDEYCPVCGKIMYAKDEDNSTLSGGYYQEYVPYINRMDVARKLKVLDVFSEVTNLRIEERSLLVKMLQAKDPVKEWENA